MKSINIKEKFSKFSKNWHPHQIAVVDNMQVILAKLKGEFVWHSHENADEFFMVIKGYLTIRLRTGSSELGFKLDKIELDEGEFYIVPKGVEHLPIAEKEAHIMMFEPKGTVNTGEIESDRTVTNLEKI